MKLSKLTNEQLAAIASSQQLGAGVAEAILVERNRGLILSTARRYGRSMDIDDAYGVAAYGFIIGVRKFDPLRGYRLSTITVVWMRQALGRYLQADDTIRVTQHIQQAIPHIKKAQQMLGTQASAQHIAKSLAMPVSRVKVALEVMERQIPLSLDAAMSEGGGTLHDIIGKTPSAEDEVPRGISEFYLSRLNAREALVIAGVMDGKTLDDAGHALGVCRERARQIKAAAFKKLLKAQKEAQS